MAQMTPALAARRQAHADAVAWATRISADRRTVYIDTETTGLDGSAEIVDIALVDADGTLLFESLVLPDQRIPTEATTIHGITNAMVAGAPRWSVVYPEVQRLLAGRGIVVYNAEFDFRMFNQMNRRFGLPALRGSWDCAMKQYSNWAGEWNARYSNFRWHKLDAALAAFDHPTASHRALDDARSCRLVVAGMARG